MLASRDLSWIMCMVAESDGVSAKFFISDGENWEHDRERNNLRRALSTICHCSTAYLYFLFLFLYFLMRRDFRKI